MLDFESLIKVTKLLEYFLANPMPGQPSLNSYLFNKIQHFRTPRGTFVLSLVTFSFQDFFFISGNQKQVHFVVVCLIKTNLKEGPIYTMYTKSQNI